MDLLDYTTDSLYYEEDLPTPETAELLRQAAEGYGAGEAEPALLRAYFLQPENLTVLVAVYRYFFYRHQLEDALRVADRLLRITAGRLGLDPDWRALSQAGLGPAVQTSIALTRFHLAGLKAAGYLQLRLGDFAEALARLRKVQELDSADRIGALALLRLAEEYHERHKAERGVA
jgi:tetratricopeptide (TPR) repeat protein